MARLMLAVFGLHLSGHMLILLSIGAAAPQSMLAAYRAAGGLPATIGSAALGVLCVAALLDAVSTLAMRRSGRQWLTPMQHCGLWCLIACAQGSQMVMTMTRRLPWPLVAVFAWLAVFSFVLAGFYALERGRRWRRDASRWHGLD